MRLRDRRGCLDASPVTGTNPCRVWLDVSLVSPFGMAGVPARLDVPVRADEQPHEPSAPGRELEQGSDAESAQRKSSRLTTAGRFRATVTSARAEQLDPSSEGGSGVSPSSADGAGDGRFVRCGFPAQRAHDLDPRPIAGRGSGFQAGAAMDRRACLARVVGQCADRRGLADSDLAGDQAAVAGRGGVGSPVQCRSHVRFLLSPRATGLAVPPRTVTGCDRLVTQVDADAGHSVRGV